MSDTTQPSVPPPQSQSPPQQAEVPVNEAPVTQPSPLGDQAPPKPPGQDDNKSSHIGRREAIQKAFERSKQQQDEAATKPPERRAQAPTAKEGDRGPQERQPQHRDRGRFAPDPNKQQPPVDGQQRGAQGQQPPAPGQQQAQPRQLEPTAPFREPPQRFSDQAKQEWANAPESVRGAVHNMAREFQGAYEKYRGDHEVMNSLRPYHQLATQQGTTLDRAFTNYYQMEQKLRQDLIGGMDVIVRNLGLRTQSGAPITLYDVAHHIVNTPPEQHRLTAQSNQIQATDLRMGQLHQMVEKLAQGFQQMQYQQNYSHTRSQVDQFAAKHPRFDELADLIKQEIDLGFPIEVAYQRADRLRPAAQAAQTRNTSAQTRKTSISGAPDGIGSKQPNTRSSDERRNANGAQHPTRREAIAKAMRRVGGGV